MNEQEAKAAIQRGESLMLCGIGGVGKTTLTKEFIAGMKERGERVEIISRCHVSAKPLSGQTADKFIISTLGGFRAGTLVIEEVSMISPALYNMLLYRFYHGRKKRWQVTQERHYVQRKWAFGRMPLKLHLGDFLQLRPTAAISPD